jgi:hypothetical protein
MKPAASVVVNEMVSLSEEVERYIHLGELTKQHGNKMIPGRIPLGLTLGSMTTDEFMKPLPVDHRDQLTEQARIPYHWPSSFAGFRVVGLAITTIP